MTMSNAPTEVEYEIEFKDEYEYGCFEQAIENSLHMINHREAEGTMTRTDGPQQTLLTDILDRAHRRRNAKGLEFPYTFPLIGDGELIAVIGALGSTAKLTERHGAAEGHDPERAQETLAELAIRIDEKFPDGSVIDGMDVTFSDGGDASSD